LGNERPAGNEEIKISVMDALIIYLTQQGSRVSTLPNDTRALGSNSLWHVASFAMAVTTKQRSLAWDDFLDDAPMESDPGSWFNTTRLDNKYMKEVNYV
jgi:outer membrane protease